MELGGSPHALRMSLIDGRRVSAGGHQPLGGVEDQLARLLALLLFLRRSLICRDHYRQTSNPANVRPAANFADFLRSEFTLAEAVAR